MKSYVVIIVGMLLILVSMPLGIAFEEKPDLMIENIHIQDYGHHVPPEQHFYCKITNNGDIEVTERIAVSVNVVRCLFGIIPLFFEREYSGSVVVEEGLLPGESVAIQFAYEYELPRPLFGIFLFNAEVDPDNLVDESNDDNNSYSEKFQVLFTLWDYYESIWVNI